MRTIVFVPGILVILLAAVSLMARSSLAQRAPDECITKPRSVAPQGSHWYFRVNRADHRHCWYLGPEGARVRTPVRQAGSPMPPGPISPVASDGPAKTTPAAIKVSKSDPALDFAMRWPDFPRSYGSVARESSSASSRYAEERMAADSQNDVPLIWPVLTSVDLAVAGSPSLSAVNSEHTLALLAGSLAFAAVIVHLVFKPVAASRLGWFGHRDQRRSASNAPRPPRPALPDPVPIARHAEVVRKSAAATCRGDIGRQPPKAREETGERPSDPTQDIEDRLRQLLNAWQRVAA
jgi:hypothetical protein